MKYVALLQLFHIPILNILVKSLFLSLVEEDDAVQNLNLHMFDTFFFEKLCKE
jgi:hypothetical protein